MAGVSGDRFTKVELEGIRTMLLDGRSGPRAQSEVAPVLSMLRTAGSQVRRRWRRKLRDWKRLGLSHAALEAGRTP